MWSTVDCLSPNCSGHGVCVRGECLCYARYRGSDCSLPAASDTVVCVRDCSQHGVFDFDKQTCLCQLGWTGGDCETGSSSPNVCLQLLSSLGLFQVLELLELKKSLSSISDLKLLEIGYF